jgi:hypothetical protein
MAIKSFDDFSDDTSYTANQKPFEFRDKPGSDKDTLEWLNNNFDVLYESAEVRFQEYRRHLALYKNLREDVGGDGFVRTSNRDRGIAAKKPVIKVNKAYEYTEARVAQASRQKVNVALIPRNDSEQEDINNSKSCKIFLDARSEEIDLDKIHRNMDRITFLYGTSAAGIYWDADAGPTSPAWEEAVKKYGEGKVPELDEMGIPTGKMLSEAPKIGDVCVKLYTPLNFFIYPMGADCWEDVKGAETTEWMHVEEVKAKWPRKAKEIEGVNTRVKYDITRNMSSVPEDMMLVRKFWHKPTEFLPKGSVITYCDEVILEKSDFPYADGKLPFVIDVDVEVPGEVWGRSYLRNIEQLIRMNNNIVSGTARAHGVGSAPKWMVPEGSVDQKQLHNDFGSVVYKGPNAPKLEFPQWVNRGEIDIQSALDTQMGRLSGIFEISKGEVPAGITAASAIRYLDEQEQQRASNTIAKRKRRVLDVYRLMISRMAQYYRESDGRTVKLLGKNNEYLIKSFKKMDFNQIYDVRLENVPLLSDTKSGRIADIIDLNAANQKDPLFGKEEMIQMLDLGLNDAFKREATYGVDTARTILEMILDGENVPDPEESDNLIATLRIFYRHIESISFKLKTPPEIKQSIADYVAAVEMLCQEKAAKNQKFAMELATMSKFPVYFDTSDLIPETAPAPLPQANPAAAMTAQLGPDASKMELTQEQIQQEMQQGE